MMLQTLPTPPTPFLRPNLLPTSMVPQTKSNIVTRRILTPPTLQHVQLTLGVVSCWPHRPTLSPVHLPCGNITWWPCLPKPLLALWLPVNACFSASAARKQQSCSYLKCARATLRCCRRKVWRARRTWRRRRQSHRKMVQVATVCRARAVCSAIRQ